MSIKKGQKQPTTIKQCIFCKKDIVVAKNYSKPKCLDCKKVYKNMRSKYREFGEGITSEILTHWFINQKQICSSCGSIEDLTIDRIIPAKKGGKYVLDNIQMLCYICNCCIKVDFDSVDIGLSGDIGRICKGCNEYKLLNDGLWYRKGFKPKYRITGKSLYHNYCKNCIRIKRSEYYNSNQIKIKERRKELKNGS